MDLNEAVKIVSRCDKQWMSHELSSAFKVLLESALDFTDQTLIDDKTLGKNGWAKNKFNWTKGCHELHCRYAKWYLVGYQFPIKTIGDLNMLELIMTR